MMSLKPYISLQEYTDKPYGENGNQSVRTLYIGIVLLVPDGYVVRLKKPVLAHPEDEDGNSQNCCLICIELFQARTQRYYGPQSFLLSLSRKSQSKALAEGIQINEEKLWPEDLDLVEVRVVYDAVEDSESSISGFFNEGSMRDLENMMIVGRSTMRVIDAGLLIQEDGLDEPDALKVRSAQQQTEADKEVISTEPFPIEKLLENRIKNIGRVVGPDTKPKKPSGPPGT